MCSYCLALVVVDEPVAMMSLPLYDTAFLFAQLFFGA